MTRKEVKVAVLKTNATEQSLRDLFRRQDDVWITHGGGMSFNVKEEVKGISLFTYCQTTPKSFLLGLKGGIIWAGQLAGYILDILMKENIEIKSLRFREYSSQEGANKAFRRFLAAA